MQGRAMQVRGNFVVLSAELLVLFQFEKSFIPKFWDEF